MMKVFVAASILTIWVLMQTVNGESNSSRIYFDEPQHVFILLVPDSTFNRLSQLRQDEEDAASAAAPSFAQTGQYVGQIIQGVLGGDVRPLFAGSVGFVEEPNANRNVGSFLATIAPTLNVLLREAYTRAQVAFGFRTTPKSVPPTPAMFEYETEDVLNSTSLKPGGQPLAISGQRPNQQQQEQLPPAAPTNAWQYVLNQINRPTSTVEPLPLIKRTPAPDGDDDDEAGKLLDEADYVNL